MSVLAKAAAVIAAVAQHACSKVHRLENTEALSQLSELVMRFHFPPKAGVTSKFHHSLLFCPNFRQLHYFGATWCRILWLQQKGTSGPVVLPLYAKDLPLWRRVKLGCMLRKRAFLGVMLPQQFWTDVVSGGEHTSVQEVVTAMFYEQQDLDNSRHKFGELLALALTEEQKALVPLIPVSTWPIYIQTT